jgi:hypothetical protein
MSGQHPPEACERLFRISRVSSHSRHKLFPARSAQTNGWCIRFTYEIYASVSDTHRTRVVNGLERFVALQFLAGFNPVLVGGPARI